MKRYIGVHIMSGYVADILTGGEFAIGYTDTFVPTPVGGTYIACIEPIADEI